MIDLSFLKKLPKMYEEKTREEYEKKFNEKFYKMYNDADANGFQEQELKLQHSSMLLDSRNFV